MLAGHRIRLAVEDTPPYTDPDAGQPAELVHNLHAGSDLPEPVAAGRRAADGRVIASLTATRVNAVTLEGADWFQSPDDEPRQQSLRRLRLLVLLLRGPAATGFAKLLSPTVCFRGI
jgi:hypothetical protein